jgi:hypothetical protein
MRISLLQGAAFLLWLTLAAGPPQALAQDPSAADETDNSSQQVEESDEEFRRRMELEDARARDLGYPTPVDTGQKGLEKIDKLPEKSRDNIRDQLIDVIVENGEWEPFDALKEYPYEPTAAAQAEPELMQREQEAWDEQIQKYHEREAAAFGAHRGPVPGPGNPGGKAGGEQGGERGAQGQSGGQSGEPGGEPGGQQGSGQDSAQGSAEAGSSGTYQPYESNRSPATDEVSTAGVQQSALDFLRGQQGQAQAAPSPAPTTDTSASEPEPESAEAAEPEVSLDTRGIIAIEDLDKLEGTEAPAEPAERDESEQP